MVEICSFMGNIVALVIHIELIQRENILALNFSFLLLGEFVAVIDFFNYISNLVDSGYNIFAETHNQIK